MDQPTKKFCACGCGVEVRGTWVRGHHSRVNNISKRVDIREKRRAMFNMLHAEGRMNNDWNKGLTKETDGRVKSYGEKISQTILADDEERSRRSDRLKLAHEGDEITYVSGSAHGRWKGGTSALTQLVRGSHQMYVEWKRPILARDGFCCTVCKIPGKKLAVHHDRERFADILEKMLSSFLSSTDREPLDPRERPELSWEEKKAVEQKVVDYHVSQSISGVTVCYECHEKLHEQDDDTD